MFVKMKTAYDCCNSSNSCVFKFQTLIVIIKPSKISSRICPNTNKQSTVDLKPLSQDNSPRKVLIEIQILNSPRTFDLPHALSNQMRKAALKERFCARRRERKRARKAVHFSEGLQLSKHRDAKGHFMRNII